MNKVNVMQEKWDYLVILDACRYDYFERLYQNYLQGKLTKRISIGSSTNEWRDKSFPDYYDDIVYISANPHFSATLPVYGFIAGEHFNKIHEIWKSAWDSEKGTVLPEILTKNAIDIIKNTNNKRFIIHYLQPHAPYLSLLSESKGFASGQVNSNRKIIGTQETKNVSTIKKKLLKKLVKLFKNNNILTNHPDWFLRKLLQIPAERPLELAWRNAGKKGLRKAYEENLVSVLKQVKVLLNYLSGTIIIPSDHGELLGEKKCYGHPPGSQNPIQIEIPWLTIEKQTKNTMIKEPDLKKDKTSHIESNEDNQKEMENKLRALGYYD